MAHGGPQKENPMSNLKRRAGSRIKTRRSRLILFIVTAVLCCSLVGVISGSLIPAHRVNNARSSVVDPPVPPPVPTPRLAKEYVYAGSKLVATEQPTNVAPTVSIAGPANGSVFTAP